MCACNSMSSASDREVYLAIPGTAPSQPTVTFNHVHTYLSRDVCSCSGSGPTNNNTCTATPGGDPAAAAAASVDIKDELDDDDAESSSATSTTVRLTNPSISFVHSAGHKR